MKLQRTVVRLALPPSSASLPRARREALSQFLTVALSLPVEVETAKTYEELHRSVVSGEADVAWAPPLVCARFETIDVPVLLRAVRRGEATYRSALFCSAGTNRVNVNELLGTRAVWVDPESCAGYLLPSAWLRAQGLLPERTFASELFCGSYHRAIDAVVSGAAEVSSVYCGMSQREPDFERLVPGSSRKLQLVGLTEEVPNDGIVVGPYAARELKSDLELALQNPAAMPDGVRVLSNVFGTERFEAAPRHGYRALYSLLSGRAERAASA
ncbi:MAG: phosphate/phosphite/phosphonate ABC transporter substrate-binding protein [Archangium sp.]